MQQCLPVLALALLAAASAATVPTSVLKAVCHTNGTSVTAARRCLRAMRAVAALDPAEQLAAMDGELGKDLAVHLPQTWKTPEERRAFQQRVEARDPVWFTGPPPPVPWLPECDHERRLFNASCLRSLDDDGRSYMQVQWLSWISPPPRFAWVDGVVEDLHLTCILGRGCALEVDRYTTALRLVGSAIALEFGPETNWSPRLTRPRYRAHDHW